MDDLKDLARLGKPDSRPPPSLRLPERSSTSCWRRCPRRARELYLRAGTNRNSGSAASTRTRATGRSSSTSDAAASRSDDGGAAGGVRDGGGDRVAYSVAGCGDFNGARVSGQRCRRARCGSIRARWETKAYHQSRAPKPAVAPARAAAAGRRAAARAEPPAPVESAPAEEADECYSEEKAAVPAGGPYIEAEEIRNVDDLKDLANLGKGTTSRSSSTRISRSCSSR